MAVRPHCALLLTLVIALITSCASEERAAPPTSIAGLPTLARPPLTTPSVSPLASISAVAPVALGSPSPVSGAGTTYTVRGGDTLSSIAAEFYGDASEWRPIYEANRDRLPDPASLSTGMSLRIPPTRPTAVSTPQR